jgi:hypothetical protein
MTRRFRKLAALSALVAFTAYYAEGVLAVFCVTDSPDHAAMTVSDAAGDAHAPASHDAPAEGSHTSECPPGMGGGTTCAPVSVPAAAAVMLAMPASSERADVPAEFNTQLLLAHSLYHPPRA